MDADTRVFLLGTLQALEAQRELLNKVMIVTFALRQTVRELGPEAAKIYAEKYQVESSGALKLSGEGALESIRQLIRQLSD